MSDWDYRNSPNEFSVLHVIIEEGEERRPVKWRPQARHVSYGDAVGYAMRAYTEDGQPNGWHAGVYLDQRRHRWRATRQLPGRHETHIEAGRAAWEARLFHPERDGVAPVERTRSTYTKRGKTPKMGWVA